MEYCSHCGNLIASGAAICKHCGHVFHLPKKPAVVTLCAILCFLSAAFWISILIFDLLNSYNGTEDYIFTAVYGFLFCVLLFCGISLLRYKKYSFIIFIVTGGMVIGFLISRIILYAIGESYFYAGEIVLFTSAGLQFFLFILFDFLLKNKRDYLLL